MTNLGSPSSSPDSLTHGSLALIRSFGEALDGLQQGLCFFDSEDKCLYWNRTFLVLFPEHVGHLYVGEPYRENLRRFYACRLSEAELPMIETYIEAGVARHRAQSRPYSFEHKEQQILVNSFSLEDGARVRIWRVDNAPSINDNEIPLNLGSGESPMSVKLILDQVPDGMMVCDLSGCITWVNQTFTEMYNLPDRGLAIGVPFETIYRLLWSKYGSSAEIALFDAGLKTLSENLRFKGAPFELPLPEKKFVRIITRPTTGLSVFYAHLDISESKRQQQLLAEAELIARRGGERAYYLATHDTLTTLPNRMLANEQLKNNFVNFKRLRIPYSVLVLDIDHFKIVNDVHGHAMGDEVLRRIALKLRDTVRESDFVARIGGEEFLVILPNTDLDGASLVAEKIRQAVEDMDSVTGEKVTISIGAAIASHDDKDEYSSTLKADEMLYAAKRAGRNRVISDGNAS